MNKNPYISVVIPAYNEEKYIGKCLKALFDQSLSPEEYEVIVVLREGSTDSTAEICAKYKAEVIYAKPGIGLARHTGFKHARGVILAGTDADTIVVPKWLEIMKNNFQDEKLVSLTGPVNVIKGSPLLASLAYPFALSFYRLVGKIQNVELFSGMNYAVRKTAYEECGGYDNTILSAEDTDLAYRISKFGKTKYSSELKVYTSPRRLKEGYLKSFIRYSVNYIRLRTGKRPGSFKHYR